MGELEVSRAQEVLRRAVQLDRAAPAPTGLTEADLLAAADELGVRPESVAVALAELRACGPGGPGSGGRIVGRLIGPSDAAVAKAVVVSEADAAVALRAWLERAHHFRAEDRGAGTVVARRRTDLAASVGRTVRRTLEGEGALAAVDELRAGSAATGQAAAICVVAPLGGKRRTSLVVGGASGSGVLVVLGVASLSSGPLVFVASPAALVVAWAVARRRHRKLLRRVNAELERTVDAAARGAGPSSLVEGFGRTLGRRNARRPAGS